MSSGPPGWEVADRVVKIYRGITGEPPADTPPSESKSVTWEPDGWVAYFSGLAADNYFVVASMRFVKPGEAPVPKRITSSGTVPAN